MAAKTFMEWWDKDHRATDTIQNYRECWIAATEATEEKFNSALRQPTQQGSKPSEITPDYSRCANRKWNCVAFIKNCSPECYKPA